MKRVFILSFIVFFSLAFLCSVDSYQKERDQMVKFQVKARGIKNPAVLKAMSEVPRHLFVPSRYRGSAYGDHPLPIKSGQTISQPYIVALMTAQLNPKANHRILEIGTGSGYQAAVLAEIVKQVFSIEIKETLARDSAALLKKLGYKNITVKFGDGFFGWEEHSPFDGIIITAGATRIPHPLLDQLAEGGRMIMPLGSTRYYQELVLFQKTGNIIKKEKIIPVRFVPMTGEVEK